MRTDFFTKSTRSIAVAGALLLITTSSTAFAETVVSNVSSSAYGLDAKVNVLGATVEVGPLAQSGGSAPPAYNSEAQVASVDQTLALGAVAGLAVSEGLQTGLITSSASSPFVGTAPATSTATATVNGLALSLATKLGGFPAASLLSLGADTISSTTSFDGSALTTQSGIEGLKGNSTISGLTLSLAGVGQTLGVSTAANFEVLNILNVIKIVSNEQILTEGAIEVVNGHSFQTFTLTTNALHVSLLPNVLNGNLVSSDIIVSSSTASFTRAIPEASTWAMMIIGFGGVGFSLRSSNRRKRAKSGQDAGRLQVALA